MILSQIKMYFGWICIFAVFSLSFMFGCVSGTQYGPQAQMFNLIKKLTYCYYLLITGTEKKQQQRG